MQRVTNIFAEHGIQYKIKAKMPFGMHPFDSATIGGVGRTSGNFEVRYSILIKKDNIEYALSLIKTGASVPRVDKSPSVQKRRNK